MALPAGATHDWQFDNATTLTDVIGTVDVPVTGAVVVPFGLDFDGTDYAVIAANEVLPELTQSADWTISFLFKAQMSGTSLAYYFQHRLNSDKTNVGLQDRQQGTITALVQDNSTATTLDVQFSTPAVYNEARVLTLRWDSTTKTLSVSANDGPAPSTTIAYFASGGNGLGIGATKAGSYNYKGILARYVTWNRRLTDAEVHDELFNEMGAFADARGESLPGYTAVITVAPASIISAEAVGASTATAGAVNVSPTGVATAEAVGVVGTTVGAVSVTPTNVVTAEAVGVPTITTGAITATATGIATQEAVGVPTLHQNLTTAGIATGEATGAPTITTGAVSVTTVGVASTEAFGLPTVAQEAPQVLSPLGIVSAQAIGAPTPVAGDVGIAPTGIGTAEAVGTAQVTAGASELTPAGIPTAEAFGAATLEPQSVTVQPISFTRETLFGTPTTTTGISVAATGIGSAEAVSTPTLMMGSVNVLPAGIASQEAFGVVFIGDRWEIAGSLKRNVTGNIDRGAV